MKRKLISLVVASLLCLSSAAGTAYGKTASDFTDLADLDEATKAKFDMLISGGVFNGVSENTFGLNQPMNRAQFAKVGATIFDLEVDESREVSSFSDVTAEDPSNGYALPYIEALKAAGITDGYGDGTFNPAGEVTKEQLATLLVRGLGKDDEAKKAEGVDDPTVSDWAKGYVEVALELRILSNEESGTFEGTTEATREMLALGAYEAQQVYDETVQAQEPEDTAEPPRTDTTDTSGTTNSNGTTESSGTTNPYSSDLRGLVERRVRL